MRNADVSRRSFIKRSVSILGTYPLVTQTIAKPVEEKASIPEGYVKLIWLTPPLASVATGATCGVCWPRGKVKKRSGFKAIDSNDQPVHVQSWPLAYWPDGSLKWTAHAFSVDMDTTKNIFIKPIKPEQIEKGLIVSDKPDQIIIDTGVMQCIIDKTNDTLIKSISRQQKEVVKDGTLVLSVQDQPDDENSKLIKKEKLQGKITEIKIEQQGAVRAVVKVTGTHALPEGEKKLIPFIVRLYFYHNSEAIRIIHTIIYDGDENKDFIKGIGISFDVPLKDELYNRHVRFVNSEYDGVFAEAVKGLTGLRRDPGITIRNQQLNGEGAPAPQDFPGAIGERLKYIPAFGDYTLLQGSASSFTIRKRTSAQHSWLTSAEGHRAAGLVYLGTPNGGLAAGIRNFWQSFPSQLDIRNAASDTGTINLWLWAVDAPAMDLRFYHDGMGQDTFEKQREGLDITYEDYQPGFGTPKGVARTSELMLWATDETPSRKTLLDMASVLQNPPTLFCDTQYLEKEKVFGGNWATADRSIPEKVLLENQLDYYFEYYKKQVDQRNWYGFWNYGDFMHSYDADRHTWRYDVGGFAWDNSELSTDLWLWYYFLHTGRADAFRLAEAMTRHTGEVDVHHLGPFAPLGSRHNVMHWGCSAKQLRISTAANRRIYYYLTADERVGDLLNEQVNAAAKLAEIIPGRKLSKNQIEKDSAYTPTVVQASFGTDWGSIAAAWLTRWERTEDPEIKQHLINSMNTIAAQPKGFFTGAGLLDLSTGKFAISKSSEVTATHLNAVFGLTEICEELIALLDLPDFTKAWLQYCRLYNATDEEQFNELGQHVSKLNLEQGHSRLTAFAAYYTKNEVLAKRAWKEFANGNAGIVPTKNSTNIIKGPDVLFPIDENSSISTNAVAQWGLAAMQCLAYIGKYIPKA